MNGLPDDVAVARDCPVCGGVYDEYLGFTMHENRCAAVAAIQPQQGSLKPAEDVERRYLADRFDWAAPGDSQEDAWIVRFCDNDVRDMLFTGEDAERDAWQAWERHAPGYNMYVFRLARLSTPSGEASTGDCPSSPDHADILETIENASDAWQQNGYTSALAEVRDMANVGRALMEALPEGYSYMNCPSEIVSDLMNERDEALATPSSSIGDVDRMREALTNLVEAAERYQSAAQVWISDSTYDADGGLAEADALLSVSAIPDARKALATLNSRKDGK